MEKLLSIFYLFGGFMFILLVLDITLSILASRVAAKLDERIAKRLEGLETKIDDIRNTMGLEDVEKI